jgi:hypothetical protein
MSGRLMVHVDPGVYQHQKTKAAARQLNLNPCKIVYHLTMMWATVRRRRTDGLVIDLSPDPTKAAESFNRDVGYDPGQNDVRALVAVFRNVGFLDMQGTKLWAHDWDEWQEARARTSPGPATLAAGTSTERHEREDEPDGLPLELRGTNYFGQFMWWLVQGFGFRDYDKSAEDPSYFKRAGQGVNIALAAEAYIAIATGLWGDDFDRRALSGRHALRKVSAFGAFKRRKDIGTLIPLTAIGARFHPAAGERGGGMGAGDAGAPAGRSGSTDPSAFGHGALDLGQHPKYGGSAVEGARRTGR